MKFSTLTRQREIGIRSFTGLQDADLSDPQYDSRRVKSGSTFVAIRGLRDDGHRYIGNAIRSGATTIVLEDDDVFSETEAHNIGVNRILVNDSRKALAYISEEAFGNPSKKLFLIGVTGTNGKTTTTNIIKQLLEYKGIRTGLIGTLGVYFEQTRKETAHTTPESRDLSEILAEMVLRGITHCVMEVSSHSSALERITALAFDTAVFTNLTQDHLDFHQSMESYAAAKQKFFTMLGEHAVAVTNADDNYGAMMTEHTNANIYSYGKDDGSMFGSADIVAYHIIPTIRSSAFEVRKRYSDERAHFEVPLAGMFNVYNTLAAVSALYFSIEGFSLPFLADAMRHIQTVAGRFEQIVTTRGAMVIVDYAHTPDALHNVLATIREVHSGGKVTTVFGCGGDRDRSKRQLMAKAAEDLSDAVIVTSDNPRTEDPMQIIAEIVTGFSSTDHVTIIEDRHRAITEALDTARENDVVLIAGKGHEDYQIIGSEKRHFSDREVVQQWNEDHQ